MLNKVQLIGNITHDLDLKRISTFDGEISKLDFQIAVNNKEKTQFIPCVIFRKQAENMSVYLHKGSKLYLEGSLSVTKYKNYDDEIKSTIKVIVKNVIFLDSKDK